jgi:hypothetical protein
MESAIANRSKSREIEKAASPPMKIRQQQDGAEFMNCPKRGNPWLSAQD